MSPRTSEFAKIDHLLAPRSVAVIGASDRAGNLGGDTVRRLIKFKFPGPVWPVNPNATTVAGLNCFPTVADLPGTPEAVVLCVQAGALYEAIEACIAKGTRAGVAFAGGLAESGTPEGIALQQRIEALCKSAGFMLCGPNCVGIINTAVPATLTFATALHEVDNLRPGAISMVSQSGGIGTTALSIALNAGFGFRALVSSGNECVVDFADYLHAFARDEGTRVLAAYLEGAGDGRKLVGALEEARRQRKPVVIIKSGASAASAKAALAHTGALAGEDRVFDAVLRETGAIRADSVEEMIDISLVLAGVPAEKMPGGKGVGIVTFGGGNGVLAADQCNKVGLEIPDLSAGCVAKLKTLLVAVASAANPMDLTPTTAFREDSLARLPAALDVLATEPSIHSLMFIVGSLASKAREIENVIEGFWRRCPKPVCVVWPAPPIGTIERLAAAGIHAFVEPARGARALARMAGLHDAPAAASLRPAPLAFDWDKFVPAQGTVVTEDRCHRILAAAQLPVAEGVLATSAEAAMTAFATLGPSVALKGISPAVTHRAAAGLLALDIRSPEAVGVEYRRLEAKARESGITLDGIYIQKMRGGGGGLELLVSAFRDPVFGTMISCGAGGGLTELLDDVVIRRAPIDEAAAASMIESLRLVRYARKGKRVPSGGDAAKFIARFSQLAASAPWSRFTFEVNPIKWSAAGAVAVDGLLIVEAP